MGPTSTDTCSYKMQGGGRRRRGEGHVEPEAETRVMQPEPRSTCSHRELAEAGSGFSLASPDGAWPWSMVSKAMRVTIGGSEPHVLG